MDLKEICTIAEHSTVRIIVSYSGDGKFALGMSDGVTSPVVANGSPEELEVELLRQIPGYREKAAIEAAERKAKEEEKQRKAAEAVALAEAKRKEAEQKAVAKRTAEENDKNQMELLFA